MSKKPYTQQTAYEAVARSLREFGYPDAAAAMVADTHKAMLEKAPIPHGIVGAFAESQMKEVWERLNKLPKGSTP